MTTVADNAPGIQRRKSGAGFAYVDGNRAVYLDYPASKTAIIEIDLDTKAKKTLLPEAGATPSHVQ